MINLVLLSNHHMVPIQGPGAEFEQVYHLRLLSVQYENGGGGRGSRIEVLEEEEEEEYWEALTPTGNEDDENSFVNE